MKIWPIVDKFEVIDNICIVFFIIYDHISLYLSPQCLKIEKRIVLTGLHPSERVKIFVFSINKLFSKLEFFAEKD